MIKITIADGNNTIELIVILYSTIRLFDTVIANCDDDGHISVFDFGGVKKKSKKGLVIMVHGTTGDNSALTLQIKLGS